MKEYMLFKKGKIYIEKYKEVCDFNKKFFKKLIKNTDKKRVLIDKEFRLDCSLGELKKFSIKKDALYVKIKLNKDGKIVDKVYRGVAPSYTEKENNLYLESISFTNNSIFEDK